MANISGDSVAGLLAGVVTSAEHGVRFELPFLSGSILQGGAETGGRFAMLEMRLQPGRGPDPHVHIAEDEYFYVLDGEYRFRYADETIEAGPGQLIKVEQGVPHGMVTGETGGRHLTIFVPAGPEGWFVEANELAKSGELDQAALGPLFERYGMTQVDPTTTGML
ncbi:MAG TPA: cupin domain-containing protein [Pseudonocardiaceae bacterium]|jgi:quercetin dioxygenase-like cupin family protein